MMREGMVEFMMGVGGGGYLELQPQAMLLTHTCARVTCMSHVTRHTSRHAYRCESVDLGRLCNGSGVAQTEAAIGAAATCRNKLVECFVVK